MTNIIELARQAGAEIPDGDGNLWEFDDFDIFHFAELIRADERAALDATEPTVPDNMQDWKGMDGTIAWHLIERHADNWADIGKMMGEWLAANQTVLDAPEREPLSDARIISLAYDCNAMPESCTDESLKLFAHAIEQEVRGK